MTRKEKIELLNRLLEIEEKNDIGNLTRAERGEFQQWVKALEQELNTEHWINDKCSACGKGIEDLIVSPEWYRNEEPNFCPFCGVPVDSQEGKE